MQGDNLPKNNKKKGELAIQDQHLRKYYYGTILNHNFKTTRA